MTHLSQPRHHDTSAAWAGLPARLALAAGLALGALLPAAGPAAAAPTIAQLVGQKLVVAMTGTAPDAALLTRIRNGQVGGVILFGANITSAAQLVALTSSLRAAAVAGGQPPLLITTDQEGGSVKRVPWAPPTISVPQMGALDNASTTTSQGVATAVALACAGVNSPLSPVADVPATTASFMYQEGRTWSFSANVTAAMAEAFASGLETGGNAPAMKHFPGIGFATANTDTHVVTITATKAQLAPGLLPYQGAIGHGLPLVMLSNATYSAYDSANAAGWSPAISVGLLRTTLGFTGVSITDSLNGTAAARSVSATSLAIKAAAAGTDMILLTGSEAASASTYTSLVSAATAGTIPLATLESSYNRILALKSGLPAPVHDTTAPVVHAPASRLYAGGQLGPSSVPVRTTWSATDPCRISAYAIERSTGGGAWATQALSVPQATLLDQSLALGTTQRYAARATDGAGNAAAYVAGSRFEALVTQQYATSIAYSGAWTAVANSYASGGTLRYSTVAGASATFRFSGSSVAWVAYRGPTRGSAAIYLDGVRVATINLYASTYLARPIVYATTVSTSASHTLRIVNLGTAGHSRVDVDAFVRLVPA